MRRTYRVGLIGVAHPHIWGILKSLRESDLGELSAASFPEPSSQSDKDAIERAHGQVNLYGDYREMLGKESLDLVFNYTDHILRAPVTELAASKGLHVMVEKPMAYNLADAERMLEASRKNNVKLMVNWPPMWSPVYHSVHQMVENGELGSIFHIRTRAGHNSCEKENFIGSCFEWMGQKEAKGAYMDFCCYGVALAIWLKGMPKSVSAIAGNFVKDFIPSYDNGTVIMIYGDGTAIAEGTWSQVGNPPAPPLIYGTKGTILLGFSGATIFSKEKEDGQILKGGPFPSREKNAVEYFLNRIKDDRPIDGMSTPDFSRDVQEVLEAGLISNSTGRVVPIPLR